MTGDPGSQGESDLARCGIEADEHGVPAGGEIWHRPLARWKRVFSAFLKGDDLKLVLNASVCFDYRHAAGRLHVTQSLTDIMREAPAHPLSCTVWPKLGSGCRPQVSGFRQELERDLDVKQGAGLGGDNIVAIDGVRLTKEGQLESAIARHEAGDVIALRLWRDGRLQTIKAKLAALPKKAGSDRFLEAGRAVEGSSPQATSTTGIVSARDRLVSVNDASDTLAACRGGSGRPLSPFRRHPPDLK